MTGEGPLRMRFCVPWKGNQKPPRTDEPPTRVSLGLGCDKNGNRRMMLLTPFDAMVN